MNKIRLYIPPLILGFIIVPLLIWPTVVALAASVITLSFLGEILFSIPLMIRRISFLELQLWLSVEYALFFCVMCCVGWQFARRTPPKLKRKLHCWLVFAPVYFWLLLWNIIFYVAPAKIALLENMRSFFLTVVWPPLNFSPFWPNRGLALSVRQAPSLVLRWDITASGVAKIEARGGCGASGERALVLLRWV